MSIATSELADWPKAPGVSEDHTTRGAPPSSWFRLFGSLPSLAERKIGDVRRKGAETGEYRAAVVGSLLFTVVAVQLFS